MLASYQPHTYEEALTMWWCVVCATGGLLLLVLGARAVGLALLGAVGGAFVGATMGVTGGPEELATALPIGASVGLVMGGLFGSILPESLAPSVLRRMGIGIAALGLVAVLMIHIGASTTCLPRFPKNPLGTCLPSWGPLAQSLFFVDALFVATLCFVTAAREGDPNPA